MAPSPSQHTKELNEDVVENILRRLYFHQPFIGPYEPDWHNLARYSRISRVWRRPAQRSLFHHLYLRKIKKYEWFCSLDALQRNAAPLNWIRILELWIGPDYLDISQIPDITSQIPYLYEMRLNIYESISEVTPDICQRLAKTTPIVSLRIDILTTPEHVQGALSLLQVEWPLRHLEIRGHQAVHDLSIAMLPSFSPRYELQEFRIFGMIRWNEILPWATKSSWESLKVLHMPNVEAIPGLPSLPPRLQSLCLSGIVWQIPVIEADELTQLILHINYKYDCIIVFQELPPTVRHFGLAIVGDFKEAVGRRFPSYLEMIIDIISMMPIHIETISLYHSLHPSDLRPLNEVMDSRFKMVEIRDTFSDMVEYGGRPTDDHWENMRAMNRAVSDSKED